MRESQPKVLKLQVPGVEWWFPFSWGACVKKSRVLSDMYLTFNGTSPKGLVGVTPSGDERQS